MRVHTYFRIPIVTIVLGTIFSFQSAALGRPNNGFDLSNLTVPKRLLKTGLPDRDGIPSINRPIFTHIDSASYLRPTDRVLGVVIGGVPKAYPIKILDHHEIVNDKVGSQHFVVTYCPLCGSGMSFEVNEGQAKTFGVSGLLYNSDVLLYDRETESLWSQIAMESVAGPLAGSKLKPIPTIDTTWQAWTKRHPTTLVLSNRQGIYHPQAYENELYPGYNDNNRILFPIRKRSKQLKPKELVIGLELNGLRKAYPLRELANEDSPLLDKFAGHTLKIHFDNDSQSAIILDKNDKVIPSTRMYWFAWYAFKPETEVYESPSTTEKK